MQYLNTFWSCFTDPSSFITQGNTRDVLHKFTVDLPKKHGRGGQSALRFARLRMEKRHNYVRKVAETAAQLFLTNDKANVSGININILLYLTLLITFLVRLDHGGLCRFQD